MPSPRKSDRPASSRPGGSDPVSEIHSASESNSEMEGARAPGGGPTHARETPPDRGSDVVEDEMAPVPGAFAADAAASAQPTNRHGVDSGSRTSDRGRPDDPSRDFGRPREVAAPAAGSPVQRVTVTGGGVETPEPSIGAADVALGKPSSGDATGDTAPREDGGQAANPPKPLGSAGGGSSGPGSANHNE